MARIDLKKTTLTFFDGTTPTPVSLKIQVGDGNLTYNVRKNYKFVKDRGLLNTLRKDDQAPLEVKFDLIYDFLTYSSGVIISPEDFLKKRNSGASLITAGADACEPYAVIIEILQNQACGANPLERITIPEFRYETFAHDLKAGTMSVTGHAKVEVPTISRS